MFILKILFALVSLLLSLFVWLCAGLLSCSGFWCMPPDEKARTFYAEECAKSVWSVRQLERQIYTMYDQRILARIGPSDLRSALIAAARKRGTERNLTDVPAASDEIEAAPNMEKLRQAGYEIKGKEVLPLLGDSV